jgi:hypothetical protein
MEDIATAIRNGEDLPGLANHVRPMVREAVFSMLEAKCAQL